MDNIKRGGGTSYICNNFETFYYSNIKSRIIAIFDNDAQGYQSECALKNKIKNLPSNMKILRYHDLNCFKKYPTLFPNNKLVNDNINKRAASIELYLADEFLIKNKHLIPVEWESRIEIKNGSNKFHLYQGAISLKGEIQNRFYEYIKHVENKTAVFDKAHWSKMITLLNNILFAYVDDFNKTQLMSNKQTNDTHK